VFLWLDVQRSLPGTVVALASQLEELTVRFDYSDGKSREYRAILPILKTGVLINEMDGNAVVRALRFRSTAP
jgi:hypothetical protein